MESNVLRTKIQTWFSTVALVMIVTTTLTLGLRMGEKAEPSLFCSKCSRQGRMLPNEEFTPSNSSWWNFTRQARQAGGASNGNSNGNNIYNQGRRPSRRFVEGKRTRYRPGGRLDYVCAHVLPSSMFAPGNEPNLTGKRDPKRNMDVPEIIVSSGYGFERRQVITEDGYILTLFRVRSRSCFNPKLSPVLLHHGFFGSSADWLMIDKDRALPFQLADQGFDVWLANARGTKYSNRHIRLSNKQKEYWNFSFHEIGIYDLPAYFDFILENTLSKLNYENRNVSYIGHSMGTTVFYICMSEKPVYNNKVTSFIALAPATYLNRMTSPARYLTPLVKEYKALRVDGPLIPSFISLYLHSKVPELCTVKLRFLNNKSVCEDLVFFLAGSSESDTNNTVLQTVLSHFPAETSMKTLIHFLQLVDYDGFRQFDYGIVENFIRYNQSVPPNYNLFRVSVNSFSFYGQPDLIIDRRGAEETIEQIGVGHSKLNFLVFDYNHIDFIWGDSAATAVNTEIIAYFTQEILTLDN